VAAGVKTESDLTSPASARVRRLDCRDECLLVMEKPGARLDPSERPNLTRCMVRPCVARGFDDLAARGRGSRVGPGFSDMRTTGAGGEVSI